MTTQKQRGETENISPATAQQGTSGETVTTVPPVNVPDIPMTFHAPQELLGTVPAEVATGFEVTRIPNTPEAIAEAKNKGQVPVHAGDRNPLNQGEPLILNEAMFTKTPEGYLAYRGDILVVWAVQYATAYRAAQTAKARDAARHGVKTRKVAMERPTVPDEAELFAYAKTNALPA